MLTNIIPDKGRKVVYAIFAIISFVAGQIGVAYAIAATVPPLWYLIGATVVTDLGVAIGATAASNITPRPTVPSVPTVTSVPADGTPPTAPLS